MGSLLVAVSPDGYGRLRGILRDVDADYATSYAGAVEGLLQNEYSDIVVDLEFAEGRILELARYAKEQHPGVRLTGVKITDERLDRGELSEIEDALHRLGYQGIVDLTGKWKEQDRRQAERDRRTQQRASGLPDRRHAPIQTLL